MVCINKFSRIYHFYVQIFDEDTFFGIREQKQLANWLINTDGLFLGDRKFVWLTDCLMHLWEV